MTGGLFYLVPAGVLSKHPPYPLILFIPLFHLQVSSVSILLEGDMDLDKINYSLGFLLER